MSRKLLGFILTFFICCSSFLAEELPEVSGDGAILIDVKTNSILYAKNMNLSFYPASTTKILTSLVVLKDLDLNNIITKSEDAVQNVPSDSSQIGLKVGDRFTLYDGLHAVLMSSDNFVCYELAKTDAGSIDAFADKMNNEALLDGADHFNFVNPHGYHDPNHYTSPYSLAKIGIAAFSNPILEKIAGTYQYDFKVLNTGQTIPLTHTAALLNPDSPYYNKHVTAVKTGFHDEAGRTLVAKAVYGNQELVGVIMRTKAPLQFEDMNKLFEYGANNFDLIQNTDNSYSLVNRTYSKWAQPYVEEALDKGWITNTTHNYMTPITRREFLNLLLSITPNKYTASLCEMINYNNNSIYNENNPATKSDIAKIIYDYLEPFNLTPLPQKIKITDIGDCNSYTQKAINFCVQANILNLKEQRFEPETPVSYEQALGLVSRLNGIMERYSNYHL